MTEEYKKIRVASLNILNNPKLLDDRVALIAEELKAIDADIICLQEVISGLSFNTAKYLQDKLKLAGYVVGERTPLKYKGMSSGNVILTKSPIEKSRSLGTCTSEYHEIESLALTTTFHGRSIEIINSHFAWGGHPENIRTMQARHIDKHAQNVRKARPDSLIIVAGDFNAAPDSDTNRYFDGKTALGIHSTQWTDAYDTAGLPDEWYTSRTDNEFAVSTALSVGIKYPHMIPNRRIDYIKSFGYNYGTIGSPLLCRRWADTVNYDGLSISDHFGLYADFLVL